jgi:photosystem II stability/assembly factor-like uncharacterized protein
MKATLPSFLIALLVLASLKVISQPSSFMPLGIGGGGALFAPSINPGNEDEFYVSCDMSELFHSTDFGNSYSQVDFTKLQVFGTSTYEFTNNPSIAYCNFNDGNEGFPVKTADGGTTWNRINAFDIGLYGHVYTMKANYDNPSQLLIGTYGDILFSGNGGNSFTLVKHAANMGAGLIIGGVYFDGSSIYIGTNEGIFHSVNGGDSFTSMPTSGIPNGQVIWNFSGSGTGSTLRFVCITANVSGTYNGIMPWDYYNYAKGVYIMEQANGNWISRSNGINFTNDFIMYTGMARNDNQTIYLAGHDHSLYAPLVIKSSDGGLTWNKVFNSSNNSNVITGWEGYNGDKNWSWSETCFGISVAPYNADKAIFGSFSNVHTTFDGGTTWKQAYVSAGDQHVAGMATPTKQPYHSIGLENTTCWQVHWSDANTMMGCFSDIGGIRSLDAGTSWGYQYNGFSVNSLYRIVENDQGTLFGACSRVHDMYQSTRMADAQLDVNDASGMIVYSQDKGATWSTLHIFNHPVFWLAVDPNKQDRMYASVIHYGGTQGSQQGGIYVTNNLNNLAASNWTKLSNPPRTEGHPATVIVMNDGKLLCTFSGRRNPAGAFTASSGVFLYDPALSAWTDVSDVGMYYWTKDIVVDPGDPDQNTWYCGVFSGWGGAPNGLGGLYRTTDRGLHWSKLTGSQFDRVTSITFNPIDLEQAYLTTETQGLWVSNNMNTSAPDWTLVSSYPFRQPERVYFNPYNQDEMWVTSFGNGLKMGNMKENGLSDDQETGELEFTMFPNPGNGNFTLSSGRVHYSGELYLLDAAGKTVFHKPVLLQTKQCRVQAADLKNGLYIWVLKENDILTASGKVLIMH